MAELLDHYHWPPYDIEKVDDAAYRITMALAGFGPDDVDLVQNGTTLTVTGRKAVEQDGARLLHRGIAVRPFKQTFSLADHVRVASAVLDRGLLAIDLVREVPEPLRPRRIEIGQGTRAAAQDNALPPSEDRPTPRAA